MQRVMVIGSPGAGKSTLARQLALLTALPLRHFDAEYWLPGWTERDPTEWQERLQALVAEDRWIIDGNYGGSLAVRAGRADTIVHLDYSTAHFLWRAMKRIVSTHGRVRADSAPGCPEQFDPAFIAYIATFRARKRAKIRRVVETFAGTVHSFTHPAQAKRWLAGLARPIA